MKRITSAEKLFLRLAPFYLLGLFCLLSSCQKKEIGPNFELEQMATFPSQINECSGMGLYKDRFIYINDGGGGSFLHASTENFSFLGSFDIDNVGNIDWEAMTVFDDLIIIGDIGNNFGNRMDQIFYYLDGNDSFRLIKSLPLIYSNQNNFESRLAHNFDAEAFIKFKNELIIFTKNRENKETDIYFLNEDGQSNASWIGSIEVPATVTDACWTSKGNIILLCNEQVVGSFAVAIVLLEFKDRSFKKLEEIGISGLSGQFESIIEIEEGRFLLASEKEFNEEGRIFELNFN